MLLIIHLHTICAFHFQGHIHCFGHFSVQISSAFLSIILLMIIQGKVIPRTLEITSLLGGPILAKIVLLLMMISESSREIKDDQKTLIFFLVVVFHFFLKVLFLVGSK